MKSSYTIPRVGDAPSAILSGAPPKSFSESPMNKHPCLYSSSKRTTSKLSKLCAESDCIWASAQSSSTVSIYLGEIMATDFSYWKCHTNIRIRRNTHTRGTEQNTHPQTHTVLLWLLLVLYPKNLYASSAIASSLVCNGPVDQSSHSLCTNVGDWFTDTTSVKLAGLVEHLSKAPKCTAMRHLVFFAIVFDARIAD